MNEPEVTYNQSQTQFSAEEPLLERPVQPAPEPAIQTPKQPPVRPWVSWAVGGAVLLIILVIFLALRSRQPQAEPEAVPEEEETQQEMTLLEQRLEAARTLLREANPTVQELPFPPVNTTLRIDPAK
jgi:hypothetical protein